MDKERALEYWTNRYNHAKDYSDIHWDAEERHEHRDYVDAMAWAMKALEQYVEAADVQPVDRWISVNEALPPDNKAYIVMTKNNGLGVSRLMGRNRIEWTLFGDPVLYWLPIPEPPETTKG